MDNWVASSLLALLCFGLWGFFPKLATHYLTPQSAIIYEIAGVVLAGIPTLYLVGSKLETHPQGVLFAVLTGMISVFGALFYLSAVSRGKISVVVTLTALYPVLTILLARLFLQETITLKQSIGIAFALVALLLFTT